MKTSVSLKKNRDFRRLYSKGKSAANALLVIYCLKNQSPVNGLGITVSKKLGGAVVRNKVRRRIKEAYRLCEGDVKTGFNIVLVARSRCVGCSFCSLQRSLVDLLKKAGCMEK